MSTITEEIRMENCIPEQTVTATIEAVEWERVTVYMTVRLRGNQSFYFNDNMMFYLVDRKFKAKAFFKKESFSGDTVRISLNVSNTGDCRAFAVGSYFIYLCDGTRILAKCLADPKLVPDMENVSRCFLHSNRNKGYLVNFFVSDGEDELPFFMHVFNASRQDMNPKKDKDILRSIFKGPFTTFRKNIGRIRWRAYYNRKRKKYGHLKNTVLFMTEQSPTLGGNLVAVKDRMYARGLDKEYTIMTSSRPASYIKQSHKSMRELITKMAKAQTVYLDDHAPILDWLPLDETTKVVQLWHAGAGFKSSGYSRWGHIGCPAPVSCHRQYNFGIAGSKKIGIFFAEVFGINDEMILPTGMPRMDEFLDPKYREAKEKELYQTYPACKGKKVILFAPTYRGKGRSSAYYPYHEIDFEKLYDFCSEEYIVFFKMHPWVKMPVPIKEEHKDRFFDVGTYPNINDLFYITEILITDYSSNIFEFSLMRKPMLFFAFDKIQYSFSRGFHRDYEEAAPGKVCYDFETLLKALENKDYEYEKVNEYVEKHFDYIDSDASSRVIDWTLLGNPPKEIQAEIDHTRSLVEHMQSLDFSVLDVPEEEGK